MGALVFNRYSSVLSGGDKDYKQEVGKDIESGQVVYQPNWFSFESEKGWINANWIQEA